MGSIEIDKVCTHCTHTVSMRQDGFESMALSGRSGTSCVNGPFGKVGNLLSEWPFREGWEPVEWMTPLRIKRESWAPYRWLSRFARIKSLEKQWSAMTRESYSRPLLPIMAISWLNLFGWILRGTLHFLYVVHEIIVD